MVTEKTRSRAVLEIGGRRQRLTHPVTPVRLSGFSTNHHATMKTAKLLLLLALFTFVSGFPGHAADKTKNRFFEMRTYVAHEGKLDFLHKRFRDHTNRIFQKHGMELVGYWTPVDGAGAKDTLVYVLAYPSREAREKAWAAFRKDPEWQKVFKASHAEAGGKIVKKVVSVYLSPTDYSPIK